MMESTEESGEGAQSQDGKVFKRQVRRPPKGPRLAACRAFAHPGRRKERAGQQRGSSPPSSAPRSAPHRPSPASIRPGSRRGRGAHGCSRAGSEPPASPRLLPVLRSPLSAVGERCGAAALRWAAGGAGQGRAGGSASSRRPGRGRGRGRGREGAAPPLFRAVSDPAPRAMFYSRLGFVRAGPGLGCGPGGGGGALLAALRREPEGRRAAYREKINAPPDPWGWHPAHRRGGNRRHSAPRDHL